MDDRVTALEPQRTLRRRVSCVGIGLHSGRPVTMSLRPAPPESGIRFVRVDAGGAAVQARVDFVVGASYATVIAQNGQQVGTVEHLLAALSALGVDNATVEIDGPEVPIMDGSASAFVRLIGEAGLRPQAAPRRALKVLRPIEVLRGDKRIGLYPADRFRVTYSISFDHPLLRYQERTFTIDEETFAREIAPARTFTFLSEVEQLRRQGLAGGGTLDNALVMGDTGVLNQALRFEDEFVRHKMLDAVGDLALLGVPVVGHLVVYRGGHDLHVALASKVLETWDGWAMVDQPAAVECAAAGPGY